MYINISYGTYDLCNPTYKYYKYADHSIYIFLLFICVYSDRYSNKKQIQIVEEYRLLYLSTYVYMYKYLPIRSIYYILNFSKEHTAQYSLTFIIPFVSNAPYLYPLKTSENLKVFCCSQEVEKGCIENEWVNKMHLPSLANTFLCHMTLLACFLILL